MSQRRRQQQQRGGGGASSAPTGAATFDADIDALLDGLALTNAATREVERPERASPPPPHRVKYCCVACQGDNPDLACGRCKTKYCCQKCQQGDWARHKVHCVGIAKDLKKDVASASASVKAREGSANMRLLHAAFGGRLADCEELIDLEGAYVNITDNIDRTPLDSTVQGGHARVAALLLSRGAVADRYQGNGWTPLTVAALYGYVKLVKVLLDGGATVDMPNNSAGTAALCIAAQEGHVAVVELLLNAGAVVNRPQPIDGTSALHLAAYAGHASVVDVLLGAGADPLLRANVGMTPLDCATQENHADVVALLQAKIAEMAR